MYDIGKGLWKIILTDDWAGAQSQLIVNSHIIKECYVNENILSSILVPRILRMKLISSNRDAKKKFVKLAPFEKIRVRNN